MKGYYIYGLFCITFSYFYIGVGCYDIVLVTFFRILICNCLIVQKLKVTYVGVELVELKTGDPRWCLDFRDMNSPAVITLSDAYGKKASDYGGFVLCPLYGRKSKAFQAASDTTNSTIISNLVRIASSIIHSIILCWYILETICLCCKMKQLYVLCVSFDEMLYTCIQES